MDLTYSAIGNLDRSRSALCARFSILLVDNHTFTKTFTVFGQSLNTYFYEVILNVMKNGG